MCDQRQEHSRRQDHENCRRHHDPEQNAFDEEGHHGHGGHHGQGHHGHGHHGHGGHGRHGLHSGRKLSGGDLQLIILALLSNRASHGYELIRSLEEHSHGLYVPSPGAIYPALTYLEEIGFASVEVEGTRKRYSLTEAGQSHYAQNGDAATRILSDMERIGAQMAQARQAVENGLSPENGEPTQNKDFPQNREGDASGEELEAARRELQRAQRKEEPYTLEEIRRVVEILQRAAADIRSVLTAASSDTSL